MRSVPVLVMLGGLGGCGRLDFEPVGTLAADAAPLGSFRAPTALGITGVDDPSYTADDLELYVNSGMMVLASVRGSTSDPWPPVAPVTVAPMFSPQISADGLTLWGSSTGADVDILFTTRASRTSPWAPLTVVPELASATTDDGPAVTADQLVIVFDSNRSGARHLVLSTRTAIGAPWSAPRVLTELDTPSNEARPHISDDRLTIYFQVGADLAFAQRADPSAPFGAPQLLAELNSPALDNDPWVSDDQRRMVFASNRGGTTLELFEATR